LVDRERNDRGAASWGMCGMFDRLGRACLSLRIA
jgi:hypothetical protein